MSLFDVPGRDTCRVRRARTDTPLAGAGAAERRDLCGGVARAGPAHAHRGRRDARQPRITYAFRRTVGRRPTASEIRILIGGVQKREARYRANPDAAAKLVSIGEAPRDAETERAGTGGLHDHRQRHPEHG